MRKARWVFQKGLPLEDTKRPPSRSGSLVDCSVSNEMFNVRDTLSILLFYTVCTVLYRTRRSNGRQTCIDNEKG